MRDFLKRHKLVTNVIKSIVFLAILGALGYFAVTSYLASKPSHVATLDQNSTAAVSAAIQAGTPVFIEVCKPMCATQLPEVDAAAAQLEGRVAFFQIDPEAEPDLMSTLSSVLGEPITVFPAHIILAKSPQVITGAKTASQLIDFITQATGLTVKSAPAPAAGSANATAVPTVAYKNITIVNEKNIKQELANVNTPIYIFLCDGRECEVQGAALDTVAGRHVGKIKFIQVDWYENPNITLSLLKGAQMPLAFPIHVIVSADGNILNFASVVMQDADIEKFISDALANPALAAGGSATQPATTATGSPTAQSTAQATAAATAPATNDTTAKLSSFGTATPVFGSSPLATSTPVSPFTAGGAH